jgi:aspartyl/asparaginyl beta-hydroxylase (cupin superfamily)
MILQYDMLSFAKNARFELCHQQKENYINNSENNANVERFVFFYDNYRPICQAVDEFVAEHTCE